MYNIFVGNLSFTATREQVKALFVPFGTVNNVLILERKKGKSRGYAFVEMPNEDEKKKAIAALEGKEFMQRILNVTHVVPKAPRPHRPKKKFLPSKKGASDVWLTDQDNAPFANEYQSKPYRQEERPRSSKPWEKSSKEFSKKGPYSKPSYRGDDRSRSSEERPRSSKPWEKSGKDFSKKGGYQGSSRRDERRGDRQEHSSKPWGKPSSERSRKDGDKRPYDSKPSSHRKGAKPGSSGGWSKDKHDSFSQATGKSGFKKFNPLGGKPRTPRTRGERR